MNVTSAIFSPEQVPLTEFGGNAYRLPMSGRVGSKKPEPQEITITHEVKGSNHSSKPLGTVTLICRKAQKEEKSNIIFCGSGKPAQGKIDTSKSSILSFSEC